MKQIATPSITLCQTYLRTRYAGVSRPVNYPRGVLREHKKKAICLTYGELLFESLQKILSTFPIHKSDTFVDLGSGFGKTALQVFLCTPAKKILGIEAAHDLVIEAQQVFARVEKELPAFYQPNRELRCIEGNLLDEDITDATVVYSCSTSFSGELLYHLGEKLNKCYHLRLVLSLKPLPSFQRLPFYKTLSVECTWDSALCYVYCQ